MDILQDVPLSHYSTMRLGGNAKFMCDANSPEELEEAVAWAKDKNLPVIVIGEGSNIFWHDAGYKGLVIVNKIMGFECIAQDETSATYKIGAGEDWDGTVAKLVGLNLSGVECLSLIPGKAGATPVQNVGAYGQEIADTLVVVHAYDAAKKQNVTITNKDCAFEYRTSRFKTTDKGHFFISSIVLQLQKTMPSAPFYSSLQAYLDHEEIYTYTPQIIRDAVVAIRSKKMPDWHTIANNGSFFANPVVSMEDYEKLHKSFPNIAAWEYKGGYKLSAGWLLEQAGLKGYHDAETGMSTSEKTALVFINENAKSTADLIKFKQKITSKIKVMFGVELQQEPELIS